MRRRIDIETLISFTLRAGVLTSMLVIVIGVAFTFIHHPDYFRSRPALGVLTDAGASFPHNLRDVAQGIALRRGQALVMGGILLLIATPIIRVAISVVLFATKRDFVYVAITATVLLLLLISFTFGLSA